MKYHELSKGERSRMWRAFCACYWPAFALCLLQCVAVMVGKPRPDAPPWLYGVGLVAQAFLLVLVTVLCACRYRRRVEDILGDAR